MKKIVIGCLAFMLSMSLYADELSTEKTFIGIEYGKGEIYNGATKLLGNINDTNNDTDKYGIRFGAENEQWRSMVVFTYEENDGDKGKEDIRNLFISVDYFIAHGLYSAVEFKPYVGLNVGYMDFQADIKATGCAEAVEESGLLYGGQAGLELSFADLEMIDVDFMFRYSLSTIDEVDHTYDFNIALHYNF